MRTPPAGQGPDDNLRGVFSPVEHLPGEGGEKLSEGDIEARRCLDGVL